MRHDPIDPATHPIHADLVRHLTAEVDKYCLITGMSRRTVAERAIGRGNGALFERLAVGGSLWTHHADRILAWMASNPAYSAVKGSWKSRSRAA